MRPVVVHWLAQVMPSSVAALIAPGWFTCVGLAGLVALAWMLRVARRHDIDRAVIASVVLWCYVAAVAAGILMPMFLDAIEQRIATGHVVLRWAGMTSFWGYLAGLAAVAVVCNQHDLPLARLGDLAAAPLGAALVLARLGCFLGGCDYGKVTSVAWAVRFPAGSAAWRDQVAAGLLPASRAQSLPVHPTELYEALLGFVLIGVAIGVARIAWARRAEGRVFLACVATYAVGRIAIEVLRADSERGIYLGLSSGQIFCVGVLAVMAMCMLRVRRSTIAALASTCLLLFAPRAHAQVPAAPAPVAEAPHAPMFVGGVLLGTATAINRRSDQVPMLAGFTVSGGLPLGAAGVWLDLESFGNRDASHGTILVSGSLMTRSGKLSFGGRAGIGATLVNFKDPVFRDVSGSTLRVEAMGEYEMSDTLSLWLRPLSIDVLTASAFGGAITTWQARAGIAYRFGTHRRAQPAAPAQPQPPYYPPPYYPQQPYPYPPTQPPTSRTP